MKRFKDVEHLLRLAGIFLFALLGFAVARATSAGAKRPSDAVE